MITIKTKIKILKNCIFGCNHNFKIKRNNENDYNNKNNNKDKKDESKKKQK